MHRAFFTMAGLCLLTSTALQAQTLTEQIATMVSDGTANVAMRLRHESVEQNNALRDADATTLRTRLSLKTAALNGFSALLEVDNIATVGADHYDSFVLDKYRGRYSVIADPPSTEVNQALISYALSDTRTVVLGRQRINHAAQRFLGSVAFRQNEQTFDGLTFSQRGGEFDFDYNYLWNVNRLFGSSKPSAQLANLDSDSHAALGTYKSTAGNFSAYAYAFDFEDAAALSSLTWGLSYAGKLGPVTVNAATAWQSDYGDNPGSFDTRYLALDAAFTAAGITFLAGYEQLGSDGGIVAFQTPLATLHKWQGWTDLFLSTPAKGIEDRYVTASGKLGDFSLAATYHDFAAEQGSGEYGKEWDLIASYPINSKLSAELKYATYERDSFAVDTDKLWLTLNLAF